MRQHLAALEAAAAVGDASVEGAAIGAQEVVFRPARVRAGAYRFAVGTAGSAGLVLQTVLLPLAATDAAGAPGTRRHPTPARPRPGVEAAAPDRGPRAGGRPLAAGLDGPYLADQLLLPLALAGGGVFRTGPLTRHASTNIEVIRQFLGTSIDVRAVSARCSR